MSAPPRLQHPLRGSFLISRHLSIRNCTSTEPFNEKTCHCPPTLKVPSLPQAGPHLCFRYSSIETSDPKSGTLGLLLTHKSGTCRIILSWSFIFDIHLRQTSLDPSNSGNISLDWPYLSNIHLSQTNHSPLTTGFQCSLSFSNCCRRMLHDSLRHLLTPHCIDWEDHSWAGTELQHLWNFRVGGIVCGSEELEKENCELG